MDKIRQRNRSKTSQSRSKEIGKIELANLFRSLHERQTDDKRAKEKGEKKNDVEVQKIP